MSLFCVVILRKYDESQDFENDPREINEALNGKIEVCIVRIFGLMHIILKDML